MDGPRNCRGRAGGGGGGGGGRGRKRREEVGKKKEMKGQDGRVVLVPQYFIHKIINLL